MKSERSRTAHRRAPLALVAFVVVGCGGSGGGEDASSSAPAGSLSGTTPVPTESTGDSFAVGGPSLVLDPAGVATVAWTDVSGVFATRFDPSSGWAPRTLLQPRPDGGFGVLAAGLDLDGNATITWATVVGSSSYSVAVSASRCAEGSSTWTPLAPVSDDNVGFPPGPQVAAGGHEELAVADVLTIPLTPTTSMTQLNVHLFGPAAGGPWRSSAPRFGAKRPSSPTGAPSPCGRRSAPCLTRRSSRTAPLEEPGRRPRSSTRTRTAKMRPSASSPTPPARPSLIFRPRRASSSSGSRTARSLRRRQ